MRCPDLIDQARQSGNTILTIPENLRAKIADAVDVNGNRMVDLTHFTEAYNDSFNFEFVETEALGSQERKIFNTTAFVIEAFGGRPAKVSAIRISNTMRPDLMSSSQTLGCWDPSTSSIVIWRPQLNSFDEFSSVLIHELVHAKTGYSDVTRDFESALTTTIGDLCLGWWNATGKNGPSQKSADARAPLASSALQTNAISESAASISSTLSLSVQDIKASEAIGELLKTKEAHAIQLDKALREIVRLREDVDIERRKTTQALKERHAIKTDIDKFRAMQRAVSAERSSPHSSVKPWYKFW